MAKKEVRRIARPGNEAAHKVSQVYTNTTLLGVILTVALAAVMTGFLVVILPYADEDIAMAALAVFGELIALGATAFMIYSYRNDQAYRRLAAEDEIIEVDPELIALWDELRQLEDFRLTPDERKHYMRHLFFYAHEAEADLREWQRLKDMTEKQPEAQAAKARVFARLARRIRVDKETYQELAGVTPPGQLSIGDDAPEALSEAEVALQLERIRRAEPDA